VWSDAEKIRAAKERPYATVMMLAAIPANRSFACVMKWLARGLSRLPVTPLSDIPAKSCKPRHLFYRSGVLSAA
jgi:hypothetical protein